MTDQSSRNSSALLRECRKSRWGVGRLRVLSDLEVGESGVLVSVDLPASVQNHLMYMGFLPDARVRVLHRAPAGDPTVYGVAGMEIALRRETARAILVRTTRIPGLNDEPTENRDDPTQFPNLPKAV